MQFAFEKEITSVRQLLVAISENQTVEHRFMNSICCAIQALQLRFDSRIDNLEAEITAMRSDSQAVLKRIELFVSENQIHHERDDHGDEHSDNQMSCNRCVNHARSEYCSESNSDVPKTPAKQKLSAHSMQESSRAGSFSLSADLVFDSPATGPRPLVSSPSGPFGIDTVDRRADQAKSAPSMCQDSEHASPDVNRLKPLRDSVENTNLESYLDADTDDEEEDKSHVSDTVLCMRAVVSCRWREILPLFFGIARPNLVANDPGSRAIHPMSPFMAGRL